MLDETTLEEKDFSKNDETLRYFVQGDECLTIPPPNEISGDPGNINQYFNIKYFKSDFRDLDFAFENEDGEEVKFDGKVLEVTFKSIESIKNYNIHHAAVHFSKYKIENNNFDVLFAAKLHQLLNTVYEYIKEHSLTLIPLKGES